MSPGGKAAVLSCDDAITISARKRYGAEGRFIVFLSACLVMVAAGALGGYLVGRAIAIHLAELKLEDYARRIMLQGEASSSESRAVLAKLNDSPYAFCSDAELSYFRNLLFHSEYLKDAARVRDGKIFCTANSGRLNRPLQLPRQNFVQPDKTKIFVNLAGIQMPDLQVVSMQLERSLIVFSPFILKHLEAKPMQYTVTVLDQASRKSGPLTGDAPLVASSILARNGRWRQKDVLYATSCSDRFYYCTTGYIGIGEVLKNDSAIWPGYTILAGVAGGLFGVAVMLIYARSRSTHKRLLRAIRKGELEVLYQPLVNLPSRRVVGVEALVRWADYDGCTVPAQVLVKLAEEHGFVGELTELVLKRSIHDLANILQERPDFRLNINISAFDLSDPVLLPMLERALEKAGIPASKLGIELTESSTADRSLAARVILELRRLGHYVCIDDFGTGYSSLSYLHDLAVDAVKIDRSFTTAIGTDSLTDSILPQILSITRSLNLQVVVEGIETEEQASYFVDRGQQVTAQGWLFGMPLSAENLRQSLARNAEREMAAVVVGAEG